MTDLPFISFVMPIRNEAHFIERSLRAVLEQDYPHERTEIIVADGMSTDATRQVIDALQKDRPQIILVDNPQKIVSTGLNAAIRRARGEIIVRVDGHAVLDPQYARACVAALQETGAECVGGALNAEGFTYMGRAIAFATSIPYGVGGSRFRTIPSRAAPVFTDTVPFGAYRRGVFDRVGLFNERMVRHQDYEFCYRLRMAGGSILLLPSVRAHYFVRSTLLDLWIQYWQYGLWKGRFLRAYPRSVRSRHLVPPLFVLALGVSAGLALAYSSWLPFGLVLGVYGGFLLLAALHAVLTGHAAVAPVLPLVLAALHVSWGLGVWVGALTRDTAISPNNP